MLKRADEIEQQTNLLLEPRPEIEDYIRAAQEAGLDRDATLQALRERLSVPLETVKPGAMVFAKGGDEHFYVATVQAVNGRNVEVRFVSGADHIADISDIRQFSLTPGRPIQALTNTYRFWSGMKVTRFNRDSGSVTVDYYGTTEDLPLERIRLPKEKKGVSMITAAEAWMYAALTGIAGTVVGSLVTYLLTRR
ncbi:MAG TPA: hypothetical protein VEX38_07085 [Fimbriimonadaceae bacterium]|nr:hypothetical protein [Fimbriimonadaceae bacterium]